MLRTLQVGLTACARILSSSDNILVKETIIFLVKFIYKDKINMNHSKEGEKYRSFDEFFTRGFRDGARPISDSKLIHPVDGKIIEYGNFDAQHPIYIKHKPYTKDELFITDQSNFISYYLAPYNHHQIYMPVDGKIVRTVYIPGMLYSVKPDGKSSKQVVNFKNERLVIFIESSAGPITLVLVGALLVGSISTNWGQRYYPNSQQEIILEDVAQEFKKGDAIARFHYGSSVILVTDNPLGAINHNTDKNCYMGESIWK